MAVAVSGRARARASSRCTQGTQTCGARARVTDICRADNRRSSCPNRAVLESAAQPFRSQTWIAAVSVVVERDGGELARTPRLGWTRFETAIRRHITRQGGQKPCLRIARRVFAALGHPAGVQAIGPARWNVSRCCSKTGSTSTLGSLTPRRCRDHPHSAMQGPRRSRAPTKPLDAKRLTLMSGRAGSHRSSSGCPGARGRR
jgi:hypothetical protein